MLTTPLVRRRRRARSGGPAWPRALVLALLGALGLTIGLGTVTGALLFGEVTSGLPSVQGYELRFGSAPALELPPARLYDRSGKNLIYEALNPAAVDRRWLEITAASPDRLPVFAQATLAFQDPAYWTHPGYDWRGDAGCNSGHPGPADAVRATGRAHAPASGGCRPVRIRSPTAQRRPGRGSDAPLRQGPDPGVVPEHRRLRQPGLRDRCRGADVFRKACRRALAGRVGATGRDPAPSVHQSGRSAGEGRSAQG